MSSQKSMQVTIPASYIHRKFSDVLRRTHSGKEHFIVERDGLPMLAIVSMPEYEEFMKERERKEERLRLFRKHARALGEEAERKGITEEQLMAELEKDKEKVYQEYYGDDQQ